jgi:WhiB family transcriptional regulator, redox-sensing transcriptional regulator
MSWQPHGNARETGLSTARPMLGDMSAHDDVLRTDWQERAACGSDPESFFDPKRADDALAVCARCEVRDPCAAYAEANDEQFGIWGGVVRGFVPSRGNRRGWSERRAG